MDSKFILDLAERAGWTGAEAALGLTIVELGDLPVWWAAPAALLAASAKAWVAKHVGRKGTASTLPASADPASA
ncbi:hypothetical protein ACFWN1_05885 [Streptomyces sp. NPDC058459]|uniref:hypothetical protein n=1 Tax=Streptomyces sp. NPDC058459 TaxID=3346508 RepID=UPI003668F27C